MIAWSTFDVGETRAACPSCGRGPRDKTLGVRINPDGAGVAHCFRCEFVTSTTSRTPLSGTFNRFVDNQIKLWII